MERFKGDKDTVTMEQFLDGFELIFPCFEQIADVAKRERAKVLAVQSNLDGKAKQFLLTLNADKKTTYVLASNALKTRFPTRNNDLVEWAAKARAVTEMNGLVQGTMTSDQYVEKANDLFNTLGDEYSLMLASKFVDGITDDMTRIMTDAQPLLPQR